MKVAVPMAGAGVAGDPFRPRHLLHGQMHYDFPTGWVVFTDMDGSFTLEELSLEGVRIVEGGSSPPPTETASPPFLLAGESAPVPETPSDSWTIEELAMYARKHGIDVKPFWRKKRVLEAIRDSS